MHGTCAYAPIIGTGAGRIRIGTTIMALSVALPMVGAEVRMRSRFFRDGASTLAGGIVAVPPTCEAAGTCGPIAGALLLGGVAQVACFPDGRGADECALLPLACDCAVRITVDLGLLLLLVVLLMLRGGSNGRRGDTV